VTLRIAWAQLPDREHSLDRVFTTGNAAIVLDGASPFEKGAVSPAEYVDHLGEHLAEGLRAAPAVDLKSALASAITSTAEELQLDADTSPASTVSIVRVGDDAVDLLVLGDTPIFYGDRRSIHEFTDTRMADLRLPESAVYRRRLAEGRGYDDEHRELLARLQRRQRERRNREGGWWIAAEDPTAARHSLNRTISRRELSWAVIATDGAANPIRHLGLDSWDQLAQRDDGELYSLLEQCHDWEDRSDPDGQSLPRSKRHDDETIVVLDFSGE